MNDREIINLIREVKEKFPNEFHETIGFMKGLNARNYVSKKDIQVGECKTRNSLKGEEKKWKRTSETA